jgi:hypothetical protein
MKAMKAKAPFLIASILLSVVLHSAGQPATNVTFTRITAAPIGTDAAHSFGCAWGDYDNDGDLDLIVGNGLGDANALYRNNGNGTFTRMTTGPIPTTIGDADGCVWGDFNNDGNLDLFVANYRVPSFLFRNDGNGNFTRVVNGSMGSNVADSLGCAWADYDNDSFLDLVVANETGQRAFLYRNNGDNTFAQIFSGSVPASVNTVAPNWADYDGDGRLDLLLTHNNTNGVNLLHHNVGEPAFFVTTSGIPTGDIGGGSGDWGDYDNDGDLDFISPYWRGGGSVSTVLYRNEGNGVFTRISLTDLLNNGGTFFGSLAIWGDYDNDGWLDVFVQSDIGTNRFLFHNNGDGTFASVTNVLTSDFGLPFGAAWGDYDNNGFLDLFVAHGATSASQVNSLYHNDGNSNRWLTIKCVGAASNRSGIGAKIRLRAVIDGTALWQLREMTGGNGFNGSGLRAYFGLGDATNADLIRIEWPSGTVQELQNVVANQVLTVIEPPRLQAMGLQPDGSFQFQLIGGAGFRYALETSSNLAAWTPLMTVTNASRSVTVSDSSATNAANRFYRAVMQ